MMLTSKDARCYDQSYCIPERFFVQFLVFVYFTVVNSNLGLRRNVAGKQHSVAFRNMPLTLTCSD